MNKFFTLSILFLITGCSSVKWHDGAMIQYKNISKLDGNKYSIEVLGGYQHSKESFEVAVLEKAEKLCKGAAVIESSEMGTYYSSVTGGGVTSSGSPPKIISVVKCK